MLDSDAAEVVDIHEAFGVVQLDATLGQDFILPSIEVVGLTVGKELRITILCGVEPQRTHVENHGRVVGHGVLGEQGMDLEVEVTMRGSPLRHLHAVSVLFRVDVHDLDRIPLSEFVKHREEALSAAYELLELGIRCIAECHLDKSVELLARHRSTIQVDDALEVLRHHVVFGVDM